MNLTKQQRTVLRALRQNRQRHPTVLSQMWSTKFELLTIALAMPAGYWMAPYDWMRWLVIGFSAGCIWGIYCFALSRVRFWPVMSQIVNWDRVEALSTERDDRTA